MTKGRTDELIRELFSLYSRYGRVEFERAYKSLESNALEPLLRFTRNAQQVFERNTREVVKKKSGQKKTKSPKERLNEFLSDLANKGDEDSKLVARFVTDIAERKVLRSAAMLRDYIRVLSISPDAKMDRQLIARKIGEALVNELPKARMDHIGFAVQIGSEKSTLQAWSDIIVKDRH